MDSVNVNIDVVHFILGHCTRNAVSQVMKTCRFLNREGVQYLLSDISLISTKEEASSFVEFMLTTRQGADIAHRLHWISSLHVIVWDQATAEALKPFFILVAPYAPTFSLLKIDNAEEFFAGADAEVSASIASLTTLQVLAFHNAGEKSVKILRALQSRLIEVEVHYDLEIGPSAAEDMDPVSYLRYSEDMLRRISLRYTVSSPIAGYYRNVGMLTLNFIDLPTTRHFVHAFPNLQCLRATECTARDRELDLDSPAQRKRDLNVAEQARDGSWSRLSSYKGSILMLYALGLACRVSHVYVHDDEGEGMDPRQLRAILGDTRPLHLTISASGVEYILARSQDFTELCRSVEFQRLPSLRLNFQVWLETYNPPDPEEFMNLLYDAIAPSPVTALVLILNFYGVITRPPAEPQQRFNVPHISSRVRLFLDSMDPDAIADRLFAGNPSRGAVKVILSREGKKHAAAQRGYQGLIVDLDFDDCF